MKNKLLLLAGITFLAFGLPSTTNAISGFNAGRIIDDSVFTNKSSMSAGNIQTFLNSKVSTCDTWGVQPSEFGGGTRRQWGEARGLNPPYTCLKDYSENGKSAAQIIYDVSQEFTINPQVLIVLLQKEQGLVTDTWPTSTQYKTATGYGCPDTAPCDSQYFGLTNQLRWSGRMFRAILDNSSTWYTPYVLGNNYIQYNPTASCGGSSVNIENRSTQALYNYTPYQPNAAALAAGWGTAQCGAYGNRNFYLYFTSWFGDTIGQPNYSWRVNDQQVVVNSTPQSTATININPGQTIDVIVKANNTSNQIWSNDNVILGTSKPNDRESIFSNSSWVTYNRPARLTETSVAPGDTGTFRFTITAPNKLSSTQEYFNILTEGQRWHDNIGMYFTINVVNPTGDYNNISITDQKLYFDASRTQLLSTTGNEAVKGSKIYGTIKFKNTGNNTLNKVSTLLATTEGRDRTSLFRDPSWISDNRLSAISEQSIQPGQTGEVNFTLQTPNTIATYTETYGLIVEAVAWMDLDKAKFAIKTIPAPTSDLATGQYIDSGQSLRSQDLRHSLVLQDDGNLVLYSEGRAVWATYTIGVRNPRLVMQDDGNLVLYSEEGRPVWNSRTAGRGQSALVLQNDRNLVTYSSSSGATWATYTTK